MSASLREGDQCQIAAVWCQFHIVCKLEIMDQFCLVQHLLATCISDGECRLIRTLMTLLLSQQRPQVVKLRCT